jgi:uncharacterized protein YukE
MNDMFGGNLAQMQQLSGSFTQQAGAVTQLQSAVNNTLASTLWTGPAADRFRSEWETTFTTSLRQLQMALEENAQIVNNRREAIALATS